MADPHKVVIIGGGFGGLSAADNYDLVWISHSSANSSTSARTPEHERVRGATPLSYQMREHGGKKQRAIGRRRVRDTASSRKRAETAGAIVFAARRMHPR